MLQVQYYPEVNIMQALSVKKKTAEKKISTIN